MNFIMKKDFSVNFNFYLIGEIGFYCINNLIVKNWTLGCRPLYVLLSKKKNKYTNKNILIMNKLKNINFLNLFLTLLSLFKFNIFS